MQRVEGKKGVRRMAGFFLRLTKIQLRVCVIISTKNIENIIKSSIMNQHSVTGSVSVRTSIGRILFSRKKIVLVFSLLLATLFIYAAYNKLIIYSTFVSQLKSSPLTKGYENFLAWFIPGIELLISALLLFKRTRLIGLWGAFFLMLAFTIYVYILPHFYQSPGCSCGGIISQFSWKEHFYFNLGFTLIAGTGLSLYSASQKMGKN
jgi:uncharacterized membrane protein YphA (DoxX/SURF4 family)